MSETEILITLGFIIVSYLAIFFIEGARKFPKNNNGNDPYADG